MSDSRVPAELYSLVFRFLKDAGLSKTAETFKKEHEVLKIFYLFIKFVL